jgi:hypothetical protein
VGLKQFSGKRNEKEKSSYGPQRPSVIISTPKADTAAFVTRQLFHHTVRLRITSR